MNKKIITFLFILSLSTLFSALYVVTDVIYFTVSSIVLSVIALIIGTKDYSNISPIKIFIVFTGIYTVIDQVWLITDYGESSSFFRYEFPVGNKEILTLPLEMLIVSLSLYVGFLVFILSSKCKINNNITMISGVEKYWAFFYISGLFVSFLLFYLNGDLNNILENINNRTRNQGRGVLVILTYLSFLGVLLWWQKNLIKDTYTFRNYLILITLLAPMLLLGSRTEAIMITIAAVYMNSMCGIKISFKKGFIGSLSIIVFLSAFQAIRSGISLDEFNFIEGIQKDLSMGIGYVIAIQNNIFDGNFNLSTLLFTILGFIPSSIKELFNIPLSPNRIFTANLYSSDLSTTFSMGVFGEARYMLSDNFRFLYYIFIGYLLSWSHCSLSRKNLFSASVIAGASIRLSKGGLTAATSNILNILILLFIGLLIFKLLKKRRNRA